MTFVSQTAPAPQFSWTPPFAELIDIVRLIVRGLVSHRKTTASLRLLSARDLRDIGLTEADIPVASPLPLPSNGAHGIVRATAGEW